MKNTALCVGGRVWCPSTQARCSLYQQQNVGNLWENQESGGKETTLWPYFSLIKQEKRSKKKKSKKEDLLQKEKKSTTQYGIEKGHFIFCT